MRALAATGTARLLALAACLLSWDDSHAQDLVITNARIVDGAGGVIERGSVVITGGRISSITEGAAVDAAGAVDAMGMTVMPGLIDTHRHDLLGDLKEMPSFRDDADVAAAVERLTPVKLRAILAQGFTTVMMPGTYLAPSRRIRGLLEGGALQGPRLLFSGPGFTAPGDFPAAGMVCQGNPYCAQQVAFQVTDAARARAHVAALANAGVDAIKLFVDDVGEDLDDGVVTAIVDEAKSRGLPSMLHAHRVEDMLDGVRLGVTRLAHTPGDAAIADGNGARLLRERGVAVSTTVSLGSPQFAKAAGFPYAGAPRHRQVLENVRHLVDQGVVVAFGTDSPDFITAQVEIDQLSTVLEPNEIIGALTRDAAIFLGLGDRLGTLAPGKIADIVVIDGDPLADAAHLAHVVMVIRGGNIVIDKRK
jgi:imidazolonepropionase-like amidohydrolase